MERPIALWIKRNRKARGWKVEELSERLTGAGYDASEVTIRGWESPSGRNPSRRNIEALERIFGSPAPIDRRPQDALDRIADILDRLTDISDLRREVVLLAAEIEGLKVRHGSVPARKDEDSTE